jgi:GNAT superfamily N-acetyltransferase
VEACGTLLGLCFEEESWSAALVEVLDDPERRRRFLCATSISDLEAFVAHESALVVDAWEIDTPKNGVDEPRGDIDARKGASNQGAATQGTAPGAGNQGAAAPGVIPSATQGTAPGAAPGARKTFDPAFDNLPAGTVLFDTAGIFSVHDYEAIQKRSLDRGCETLNAAEAQMIRQRAQLLDFAEDAVWCARACPDGYGYIAAVCVNPRYRGRGVLGALLDPIIARAEDAHIPLCLETYDKRSKGIYSHKGFRLIDTAINREPYLTQYRMVR